MAIKKAARTDVDWYLISIDRLKQIGLVILLIALGLAGWWFFSNQKRNPRSSAESAITGAREALNELASSKDLSSHRTEFDRAQKKLDEATTLLTAGKYPNAQEAAVESQTISRAAISGEGGGTDFDAQFNTVEGDVQFQKAATSDWKRADMGKPLFNGDWVKTGENASAELFFSNGSLYTVGPNALLEIYAQFNPATAKKSNSVQMQIGSVEVATTDDVSTVRTPGSQVVVDYIRRLRGEGKAVILSTHRLDEAERLCDRFGLLHHGQLRLEGTLAELRAATGCHTLVEMFRSFFQAAKVG